MLTTTVTCGPDYGRNRAALNGAVVSTLYWSQTGFATAQTQFGASALVGFLPALTLCGYAGGVLTQATLMDDMADRAGLLRHGALLVLGLSLLAMAPTASVAALACFLVGLGCSLTQRLLALTAAGLAPSERASAIGRLIACGLLGVIAARALVPDLMGILGWRTMFGLDACACTALILAASEAGRGGAPMRPARSAVGAWSLWRRHEALRRAALLQGSCFALFTAGWALYPRLAAAHGLPFAMPACAIASLGAAAAFLAGRLCRRLGPDRAAAGGAAILLLGVVSAAATLFYAPWAHASMVLIEAGTQLTLVANHARVQAQSCAVEQRGRMAAILTTVGFAGGGAGAAVASLLQ